MNASASLRLPERLQEALSIALREQLGIDLNQIKISRVILRLWSQVYHLHAHTSEGEYDVILKCNGKAGSIPCSAEKKKTVSEFRIMQALHDGIQVAEGCFVARPIAVLSDQAALLLEFVEGDVLSTKTRFVNYFADRREFLRLTHAYRLCGRWLRRFQQITESAPQSGDAAIVNIRSRLETRLAIMASAEHKLIPARLSGHLRNVVDRLADELRKADHIPMVGRHSDFGPWNMLIKEDKLTVLDFHDYHLGPAPEDIMKILIHLDRSSHYLTSSRSRYQLLLRAFLEGYGELPDAPQSLIVLLEIMERVQFLVARLKNPQPKSLYRRIEWQRDLRLHVNQLRKMPASALSWHTLQREMNC